MLMIGAKVAGKMTLYEVAIADGRSVSPFVWRIKLALVRKRLSYDSIMLALTDIPALFDGRFQTVPILDVGDRQISESLAIADWLDATYPDLPQIFSSAAERAMIGFFDHWLMQVIIDEILPLYALDAHDCAAAKDQHYYRQSREAYFGRTLEEVVGGREQRMASLRRSFEPVRQTVAERPFVGGDEPNFADMCMVGLFILVGSIGTLPMLTAEDPLTAYANRALDFFASVTASLDLKLSYEPHLERAG